MAEADADATYDNDASANIQSTDNVARQNTDDAPEDKLTARTCWNSSVELNTCCLIGSLILCILIIIGTGFGAYYLGFKNRQDFNDINWNAVESTDTLSASNRIDIDVRLPTDIVPESYELRIVPFIWPFNFTFNGEVEIVVNVTKETNLIVLHAIELYIDQTFTTVKELTDKKNETINKKILKESFKTAKEFYVIEMVEPLTVGKQYVIYILFFGSINNDLRGFYRSAYLDNNYEARWLATTTFEPTDARRAFPCFDEPALKATFQISIARPSNMTAISNMPKQRESRPVKGMPDYVWDHFEPSVPMSTYLVTFTVSDFGSMSSSERNVSVWAQNTTLKQASFSLEIAPKILHYYEDFFQIKYPLPKIDMIAIPQLAPGAIEHWGLISFKEIVMLFQEGVSSRFDKQNIVQVVSHELAHQWFGNLVTPKWWTDIWLNEGFASYMENFGIDAVDSTWRAIDQFVIYEVHNVLELDALKSSHPVSIEVKHPDEVNEIFDRISYIKGASVIRMMDHFLTTPVFKRGLTNYLNAKAYKNAMQDDLWEVMTNEAHKSKILDPNMTVKQIMDTWTLQTGYPVLTVVRDYDNNAVTISQERFTLNNITVNEISEPLWWIPLSYTSSSEHNFNSTKPLAWMKPEKSMTIENISAKPDEWLIFNILQTGFYRVNYDLKNWNLIFNQLNNASRYTEIAPINRAQLLNDVLTFARVGRLDYAVALNITAYLKHEVDHVPWCAAFKLFDFFKKMIYEFEGFHLFRKYILELTHNAYQKVGFNLRDQDQQLTVFLRTDLLHWACDLGHEDCVRNAISQFTAWRSTPNPSINNPIPTDLKRVIYCTAIKYGSYAEWNFVFYMYLNEIVVSEQKLLIEALSCTRETWLLRRLLDMTLAENSNIRREDATVMFRTILNNDIGKRFLFDYTRHEWQRIKYSFGANSMTLNYMLRKAFGMINKKHDLEELKKFAHQNKEELNGFMRIIQQAIEQAEANIQWLDNNFGAINTWLRKNVRNSL